MTHFPWPDGEHRLTLVGDGLDAVVLPTRGAKIISLRDARGVEWLAQPDRPIGAPARPGDDFLSAEMAGWDECAPTIVACEVDGIPLADHGELWTMDFTGAGATVSAHDPTLGYDFRRTIRPVVGGLVFDYEVTGGSRSFPFLWAAHPQFRAPAGTRIELPTSVTTVIDVMDDGLPELPWSDQLASIDTIPDGGYRKLYPHPEHGVSSARLVHPDGAALEMEWTSACPYVGLWFDKFAFRSEAVIAIEPSTAYFDSLTTAVALGRASGVESAGSLAWTVTVRVTL